MTVYLISSCLNSFYNPSESSLHFSSQISFLLPWFCFYPVYVQTKLHCYLSTWLVPKPVDCNSFVFLKKLDFNTVFSIIPFALLQLRIFLLWFFLNLLNVIKWPRYLTQLTCSVTAVNTNITENWILPLESHYFRVHSKNFHVKTFIVVSKLYN